VLKACLIGIKPGQRQWLNTLGDRLNDSSIGGVVCRVDYLTSCRGMFFFKLIPFLCNVMYQFVMNVPCLNVVHLCVYTKFDY